MRERKYNLTYHMFTKKVHKHLSSALMDEGFENPKPLQKICIPKIKSGADLLCVGPEKSGKSSTIVITVIQKLDKAFADVPRALIVVPDRERAFAMKEMFDNLGKNTNLRVFCAVGGENIHNLRDTIYEGSDVVIGTAKRLNELYSFSGINLNNLKMFVVDDAQLILKDEILSQLNRLSENIPKSQHILFTNKLTNRIESYQDNYMNVFNIIDIEE